MNNPGITRELRVSFIVAFVMLVVVQPLWSFFTNYALNQGNLLYLHILDTLALKASFGHSDELIQRFYIIAWSFGSGLVTYIWVQALNSTRELVVALDKSSGYGGKANCEQVPQVQSNPEQQLDELVKIGRKRIKSAYRLLFLGAVPILFFIFTNLYAFLLFLQQIL